MVWIDSASELSPEVIAARLLDLLQQPFQLDSSPTPICVSASVDGTTGVRSTGGELLRHADMALDRAKDAGRNRYEVSRPEIESAMRDHVALA